MLIKDLVERFKRWCAEHHAESTVRLYHGRLKTFVQQFGDQELGSLTPLDIDDWLQVADRRKSGELLAPDTRRSNRNSFKALQTWAIKMKQLEKAIVDRFDMPSGRRRERIPTTPEILQILRLADKPFRRIYIGLLRAGARPNELCRATTDHIQLIDDVRVIVLKEHKTAKKTGKPRRIPIGRKLGRVIERSLGERTTGPLFLSSRGRQWTPSNLSTRFKKYRRQAGLSDDLVLYCARHHKGTNVCRKLGIKAAAEVLGHSNTQTTERYIHLTTSEVRDYQDAA